MHLTFSSKDIMILGIVAGITSLIVLSIPGSLDQKPDLHPAEKKKQLLGFVIFQIVTIVGTLILLLITDLDPPKPPLP